MPRAGTRLAGDYYGLVWAGAGDQDYKRDCLGLANTQSKTDPCIHKWGSILHWCIPSVQIVFLYSDLYRHIIFNIKIFYMSFQAEQSPHMATIAQPTPHYAHGGIADPMLGGCFAHIDALQTAQQSIARCTRMQTMTACPCTRTSCTTSTQAQTKFPPLPYLLYRCILVRRLELV